jgi:Gly-Xaa carboxypeptidase
MTEKGNAPFKIEIDTTGGHASVPPKHTGRAWPLPRNLPPPRQLTGGCLFRAVGYLSLLLAHLEAHPVQPKFTASHPLMRYYQCLAEHNPAMPADFRRLVEGDEHDWAALAQRLADESDMLRSFLATSRAVDVVHGGSKSAFQHPTAAPPPHRFGLIVPISAPSPSQPMLYPKTPSP